MVRDRDVVVLAEAHLGDPGAVKEYNVRFTSPVYVPGDHPAEVEYTGKVKSVDPENRTAVIAIVAKSGGRKIFGRATATARITRTIAPGAPEIRPDVPSHRPIVCHASTR